MFRFGTGFGLLQCRLSEFNDDIHGEPDERYHVEYEQVYDESLHCFVKVKKNSNKKACEDNKTTKYSTMKKLKSERTLEVELDMER